MSISNLTSINDAEASKILTQLRDQSLKPIAARRLVAKLTATLTKHVLKTPEADEQVAVIVVLRSGLAMAEPFLDAFPEDSDVVTYHLGLFREKQSLRPVEYYNKLPRKSPRIKRAYILDPLVATGGTARAAIDILK
jgi:uracil phosphoribosyltransferase